MQILDNLRSLPSNPLFKDYESSLSHRFYNYMPAMLCLLIYEGIMLFAYTPQLKGLESGDVWFIVFSYFPLRSLLPSFLLLVLMGYPLFLDYMGIKDGKENSKDAQLISLGRAQGIKEELLPSLIKPKAKFRWNGLFLLRMLLEVLVYSSILYFALPIITDILIHLIAPSSPPVIVKPPQLVYYQSNAIQGIAIAFGSGFYEEFIYRRTLIHYLNQHLKRWISDTHSLMWGWIPVEGKLKKTPLYASSILVSSLLYSLSHILLPSGESFQLYTLIYRLLQGVALSYILIKRKFAIAAWTHAFYDLFYFSFI